MQPDRPRLSRRHAAGADSARGLLLTVLGEFVLPGARAATLFARQHARWTASARTQWRRITEAG